MNDDFLYKFRKPPRREFAAALYQRISKPMKPTSRIYALRYLAMAFSIVTMIAGILFFSPPTRALADSIIRQFGGYIFVQATPQPDPAKKGMTGQDMTEKQAAASPEQKAALQAEEDQKKIQAKANKDNTANVAQDAAAASQLAGFTVLAPSYMPDGYTAQDVKNLTGGWEVSHENSGVAARTRYYNQAAGNFLVIEELKYEQGQSRTVDRPEIEDVTVRGQPGVWMPDEGGKSTLAWEENGITYLVVSNMTSRDELLKVAESLGK